ncbi:MAG: hypothetical protein JW891_16445 [Candidatus Lokiarchaeota archaeon]|nr:hypothetical protein [Candidatus Lokiarchaeota archaeon]
MERVIVVRWSVNTGPEPIIQYPPAEKFPPNDLFVKLWTIHELNKERSMLEFVPEGDHWYISVTQQYSGELYLLVLAYSQNADLENIIDFDILSNIAGDLIESINTNRITRAISETFNTIKDYSKIISEKNFIIYFQDKIKITILQILRNGVISKTELVRILKDNYGFSTLNIDLLLTSFIRDDLIIRKAMPGSKECYFLIKDISIIQLPPKRLPQFPEDDYKSENIKAYKDKIKSYYNNMTIVPNIENKIMINLLVSNSEVYFLFKSLRKKTLSVHDCLVILNNNEDLFYDILDTGFIYENKGYVALILDFRFVKFKPFYIIKNLSTKYKKNEISLNEFITHLKLILGTSEKINLSTSYQII